jgi:hypothetical protein
MLQLVGSEESLAVWEYFRNVYLRGLLTLGIRMDEDKKSRPGSLNLGQLGYCLGKDLAWIGASSL